MIKRNLLATLAVFSASVAPVLAQTYNMRSNGSSSSDSFIISLIYLICCCVFILPLFILQIYLTVDALKRDYGTDSSMKAVGIIFLWVLSFPIGTILYVILVMNKYPKLK